MRNTMQQASSLNGRRPPLRRIISAVLALGCLVIGAAGAVGACSSTTKEECIGGFKNADGICEGKCKPGLCKEGNTCVDNRCVLKCTSHADCYVGAQECAEATE